VSDNETRENKLCALYRTNEESIKNSISLILYGNCYIPPALILALAKENTCSRRASRAPLSSSSLAQTAIKPQRNNTVAGQQWKGERAARSTEREKEGGEAATAAEEEWARAHMQAV
jgi:hypothetical protein